MPLRAAVADWSQAGIDYTGTVDDECVGTVADWSQAGIDYTLADPS